MLRNSAAFRIFVALLALWAVAPALPLAAHDIPSDATVQMFFKPAGNRLNILVRVPLKAMRDVEFPERAQGLPGLRPRGPDAAGSRKFVGV